MKKEETKIAFLYDFDKTLTIDDMQNQGFLQKCGLKTKAEIGSFWAEVGRVMNENIMDKYISFMYCMLKIARRNNIKVTRKFLNECGESIKFFPGVEAWFSNIDSYCKSKNCKAEHYIISSGNKEIIEGTNVSKFFKRIYASYYHYDDDGVADWPSCVINYTNKTQFLYRIKKQILELNDERINSRSDYDNEGVPFSNIVYIGDSDTDIPCMEIVKHSGGNSICVYQKSKDGNVDKKAVAMMQDNRVNYYAEADYTLGGKLWNLITKIIDKIVIDCELKNINSAQMKDILS